jgi:hypothetical protein
MKATSASVLALVVAICLGCGPSERVRAARQYEKSACACQDKACAEAADRAYGEATCGKGVHGATFACEEPGRTFVSPSASEARDMEGPEQRAQRCLSPFFPQRKICGGIGGVVCPDGGRCVMSKDEVGHTDRQGQCYGPDETPPAPVQSR